jgi:hypothetical protein
MPTCPECGAVYARDADDCGARFDALLALDHSRTEPWGSRHGLAFSAFALQHPGRFPPDVAGRAWIMLYSVYILGSDYQRVTTAMRRMGRQNPDWGIPPLPAGKARPPFTVTIANLGSFEAEKYPELLDRWCNATLAGWRGTPASRSGQ